MKHSEESAAVDNTGDPVHVSHDEWWCPTDGRWVLCPGPCPDGSTHAPRRTIALAQVQRGEDPAPNTAALCVLALARLAGRHDWTEEDDRD